MRCERCGSSTGVLIRSFVRQTGTYVGPLPVTERGYESANLCGSCDAERFVVAAAELEAATDRVELQRLVNAGPPPTIDALGSEGPHAWYAALGRVWRRLVAQRSLGLPTHELLGARIERRYLKFRLLELSRTPVWLAPRAAKYMTGTGIRRCDVWVDENGALYPPLQPNMLDGGASHLLSSYPGGRVHAPEPLLVVVATGGQAGVRLERGGSLRLVNCVLVGCDRMTMSIVSSSDLARTDLRSACSSLLARPDGR
jgi:hypothetical protein